MKQHMNCPKCGVELHHFDPKLMVLAEVLKMFPVSESTWWAGISRGIYPKPLRLSPRRVAWRVEDIHALIDNLGTVTDDT